MRKGSRNSWWSEANAPASKSEFMTTPALPGARLRRRWAFAALYSALIFLPQAALAADAQTAPAATPEDLDTLNFVFGGGMRYDDNLFRASTGKQSDIDYSANAGIKLDKPYSLQRFQLDATLTEHKFRSNDFLDYHAFDYRAAWLWSLTPKINGILLAKQEQVLNDFADFRTSHVKSIQTNEVRLFNIDGDVGGGVHLLGGLLDVRSRNSKTFQEVGDYQQDGAELGVKYVSRAQNWISLVQRETNGQYRGRALDPVAQLDTGFDEHVTEAALGWQLTGKSELGAKLGHVARDHDHFSARDYSGTIGRVVYRWKPTGKLRLDLSLSRNLFSFQEDINSYYVADTLSIEPVWKFSPKTTLRLRYDYGDRDYRGAIVPTAQMRQDSVQKLLLSADWQATRRMLLTGSLQHERRNSNLSGFDFDDNAAMLNASILF